MPDGLITRLDAADERTSDLSKMGALLPIDEKLMLKHQELVLERYSYMFRKNGDRGGSARPGEDGK